MDLLIRPVRLVDAAAVAGILNAIIEAGDYTVLDTPFSIEAERRFIAGFPVRGVFHVAEYRPEGRIVGFQNVEPFATYTAAFDHVGVIGTFVDLDWRGQGIGRRLAEATFTAAVGQGYEKLFTYVRADNPAALAYYQALGFRIIGTAQRQARLAGRYVDEVIIERFLGPSGDGAVGK